MNNNKATVKCSILGENFTLSCNKDDEVHLRDAIKSLQESAKVLLNANPNLSPQQAAILTALKALTQKKQLEHASAPFLRILEEQLDVIESVIEGATVSAEPHKKVS